MIRPHRWILIAAVICFVCGPRSAFAGAGAAGAPQPLGAEFQVNTYTFAGQTTPAVAIDAGSNFVVVWQSDGSSGPDVSGGILGQRFDSGGAPVGAEFQVNTYTTGSELFPAVVVDANGNFVVAWTTDGAGLQGYIREQLFDSAGARIGGELQVNTYTLLNRSLPRVAADADGNFVVVWQSDISDGSDGSGTSIQGQRFSVSIFTDGFESGDTAAWSSSVP